MPDSLKGSRARLETPHVIIPIIFDRPQAVFFVMRAYFYLPVIVTDGILHVTFNRHTEVLATIQPPHLMQIIRH